MNHKRNFSKIRGSNEKAVKEGNIYTVGITVTDAGEFEYEPSIVKMDRGDTIEWKFDNEKYYFAVHLGWNTPLDMMQNQGTYKEPIRGQVREDAPNGWYKYFVAAFDRRKEMLLTDDPEFIVKPPKNRGDR